MNLNSASAGGDRAGRCRRGQRPWGERERKRGHSQGRRERDGSEMGNQKRGSFEPLMKIAQRGIDEGPSRGREDKGGVGNDKPPRGERPAPPPRCGGSCGEGRPGSGRCGFGMHEIRGGRTLGGVKAVREDVRGWGRKSLQSMGSRGSDWANCRKIKA